VIAALGLLVGIVLGLVLQPDVPLSLEPYLPIAVVAALAGQRELSGRVAVELRAQRDGRDLRLVADLDEEEGDCCGQERAKAADPGLVVVFEFVRHQRPRRHRDETDAHRIAEPLPVEQSGDRVPEKGGNAMIGKRGDEDAEDDRHRRTEPRGEHDGEQHGLVADLGQRDHGGRGKDGVHFDYLRAGQTRQQRHMTSRPARRKSGAIGLARADHSAPLRHDLSAEYVDAREPLRMGCGGLLPR